MLRVEHDGGVVTLTLDRPSKRNALSPDLLRALRARCLEISEDETVRVVVLRGEGGCFSAGADLLAMLPELRGPDALAAADLGRVTAEALDAVPVPTVAVIDGPCVGGGVVLACACDLVVASDRARFRVPEVAIGVPLAWGGTTRLVRRVGPVAAADLVMTCRWVDAHEALQLGLISRGVPVEQLDAVVAGVVGDLARRPRRALATTRKQIRAALDGVPDDEADAAALLAALGDPETLAAAQRYLSEQLGAFQP